MEIFYSSNMYIIHLSAKFVWTKTVNTANLREAAKPDIYAGGTQKFQKFLDSIAVSQFMNECYLYISCVHMFLVMLEGEIKSYDAFHVLHSLH